MLFSRMPGATLDTNGGRSAKNGSLLRLLGVAFGVAVAIGGTIGPGILRRPGAVAGYLNNTWLILGVWAFGGLYSLAASLTVAELSVMTPLAGGPYVLTRRAMGDTAGFAVGWCDWMGNTAAVAFAALSLGDFAGMLTPRLAGKSMWIAAAVILLFALLQSRGLRESAVTQQATSLLVCVAFALLIGACFWSNGVGHLAETGRRPAPGSLFSALILAMQSVFVTYDGWYTPIYFVEEDRDPTRNLPRIMLTGAILIAGIYLLLNTALLAVLPFGELAGSELPAATAARSILGERGRVLLTGLLLMSLLPLVSAATMSGTRILFGISRDVVGWLPGQKITRAGTPIVALWISTAGALLFLLSGSYERLLGIAGFFYVAMYCATFSSMFLLRAREPDAPRPYRVPLYPWTPAFVLICGLIYLAGVTTQDPVNSGLAVGLLAVSAPVYLLIRKRIGLTSRS